MDRDPVELPLDHAAALAAGQTRDAGSGRDDEDIMPRIAETAHEFVGTGAPVPLAGLEVLVEIENPHRSFVRRTPCRAVPGRPHLAP